MNAKTPDNRFVFMVRNMSAWDAAALINEKHADEYMLGKLMSDRPGHEVELHQDAAEPGDPVSPVIESATVSGSHFYVEFAFEGTPVRMTVPVMTTIEIGWLERQ